MPSVEDTPTVRLTYGPPLTAAAKISGDEGNELEAHADGLFVGSGAARAVSGIIDIYGATLHGTGFSADETSTGHYTVTFDVSFDNPPAVVVTSDASLNRAMLDGVPGASSFDVVLISVLGYGDEDSRFCFRAVAT